mgnify:CR=1 FL=1
MKIIGIIQVRMGSSRLPNKALEDLSGSPAIVRMVKRVQLSNHLNKIYIATGTSSTNDEGEAIKSIGKGRGWVLLSFYVLWTAFVIYAGINHI